MTRIFMPALLFRTPVVKSLDRLDAILMV